MRSAQTLPIQEALRCQYPCERGWGAAGDEGHSYAGVQDRRTQPSACAPTERPVFDMWRSRDPRTRAWVPYSPETSAALEAAFQCDPQGTCHITVGGRGFRVDFPAMLQRNTTGGYRRVERRPAPDPGTPVCVICDAPVPDPTLPTAACAHADVRACAACMAKHVEAELNRKGTVQPLCPIPECRRPLEYTDVQRLVTPAVFQRYDRLLTHRFLQQQPNFRWCKNATCGSGMWGATTAECCNCEQ